MRNSEGGDVAEYYENTGNDQRTQPVHISPLVNGVPLVAAASAEGTKIGLASMGASILKGNVLETMSNTSP